ncbi:MAG: response regulator, partial [Rhodospirillales bacterium]|nr:response regulator [Rhodospirillales bacterium]
PLSRIIHDCETMMEQASPALAGNLSGIVEAARVLETATEGVGDAPAGETVAAAGAPQDLALVVDDNEVNLNLLTRLLVRLGYRVEQADNGRKAMSMIRSIPVDVVLLDIMMPEMDGYEVLTQIKSNEALRHIPVIMVTALDEMRSVVRCIQAGAVDYLTKPFDPVLLKARVGACIVSKRLHDRERYYRQQVDAYNLHLEERVREQVRAISHAQLATIFALSKLAESRDPETGDHLERMREYCRILARQMSTLPKHHGIITEAYIECIFAASPLHDIGKVGVPDSILQKPGKLTEEEFEVMKIHTLVGASTLRAVHDAHPGNDFIHMGIEIAESHHEKWNGAGYPLGLAGEAIPLSARILALADVYDALRSKRCYKDPMPHDKVREILVDQRGKHFDPDVLDCFLACEDAFTAVVEHYS